MHDPVSLSIYGEIALVICVSAMIVVMVFASSRNQTENFEKARHLPLGDDPDATQEFPGRAQ